MTEQEAALSNEELEIPDVSEWLEELGEVEDEEGTFFFA